MCLGPHDQMSGKVERAILALMWSSGRMLEHATAGRCCSLHRGITAAEGRNSNVLDDY
jgi:hypothetical protein